MRAGMRLEEKVRGMRAFLRREGRLPGYEEMCGLFGCRSKNAVFQAIARMVRLGYLRKGPGGKLAPTGRLRVSVRLLGTVQAGFPSPAEEELVDTLSLDAFLVERPEATFLLTVSGDSMIEAGIQPGDLVLVERGRSPRNGDIVVAQVDEEWTLKYYTRDRAGVRLDPANRAYAPIRPKRTMVLGGVVRAVVRKY
jgi:SOS regulatory protein LexA